jgi:hypothetical protein
MSYVPCRLAKYFVFNPLKFGLREENDFEKIFFYWPSGKDLGEQMMDVGLCEALVHLPKYPSAFPPQYCSFLSFSSISVLLLGDGVLVDCTFESRRH